MTNLEKEIWFDQISNEYNNNVVITPLVNTIGNQSIVLTLPCECRQTQHFVGHKKTLSDEAWSVATQFFEFCPLHNLK